MAQYGAKCPIRLSTVPFCLSRHGFLVLSVSKWDIVTRRVMGSAGRFGGGIACSHKGSAAIPADRRTWQETCSEQG